MTVQEQDSITTLDEARHLMDYAIEAQKHSYAPYSHFNVGAALLSADGSVHTGCNIENAAFGPSCCAERTAFFKAVSGGVKSFKAIAIAGGANMTHTDPCPPCGVCRQVMREFCADGFCVITMGKDGILRTDTLGSLLPHSFGPAFLS